MSDPNEPILLDGSEAARALSISSHDLEWLVATRQLFPVTIRGQRRFVNEDLCRLARVYQSIQNRE